MLEAQLLVICILCLSFDILLTTEPIDLSILGRPIIGPWMVLGNFSLNAKVYAIHKTQYIRKLEIQTL